MSNVAASVLKIAKEGAVLTLTLQRAEVMNAVNRALGEALVSALHNEASEPDVRCVIITGAGATAFCAGQDLAELLATKSKDVEHDLGPIVDRFNDIVRAIVNLPKPVIAAVNGAAAGAGANIALACDFVLAAEHSYFMQSFIHVGLIPDSGGTFMLPRLVGLAKSRELMFLGEKVPAQRALGLGMIYKVCGGSAELERETKELALKLAALPTKAIGLMKKALEHSLVCSLGEQLGCERDTQIQAAKTADYAEGISAFVEKRRPKFVGH